MGHGMGIFELPLADFPFIVVAVESGTGRVLMAEAVRTVEEGHSRLMALSSELDAEAGPAG